MLSGQIQQATGKVVHPETIKRSLRFAGYQGRVPRKKLFISSENQRKRLQFANEYIKKDLNFWKTVLFTDESKFNIFGCDGRGKIWRKRNEEMKMVNLVPTVKHRGGHVIVWGSMATSELGKIVFIEGNMDRVQYLNILRANLQSSVDSLQLGNNGTFQQDNDPKHTALIVKTWLIYYVPHQLHSFPQSPDINPIEHIWDEMERRIRKFHITDRNSLKDALERAWNEITPEITENLVSSMPKRLQAVIDSKGGPTKY